MSTTNEQLDKYIRKERVKKASILLGMVLTFSFLVAYIVSEEDWTQREVIGTFNSIQVSESQVGNSYIARVSLENGESAIVKLNRASNFMKGREAVLIESTRVSDGKKMYSFIRQQ